MTPLEIWKTEKGLRDCVEGVVGRVEDWCIHNETVSFRPYSVVTLKKLTALAAAVGTDAINFTFGKEGEPAYSEVTPGCDGSPGLVSIVIPSFEASDV